MLRRTRYSIAGAVLGLGAPAGWLVVRMTMDHAAPGAELRAHPLLYAYLTVMTVVVFTIFGRRAGRRMDAWESEAGELREQALTDPLTTLGNRRQFMERLAQECERARRNKAPLTLVVADLDRFKAVNDEHGHDVGDAVLSYVGETIRALTRKADSPCRIGGEEFAILCPDTKVTMAAELAERIRRKLDQDPYAASRNGVRITASFGAAAYDGSETDADFFRRADAALYRAKQSGRNRVEVAHASHGA